MQTLRGCKHVGKIERVYVDEFDANCANVVYWCSACGAIQIFSFHEYNGKEPSGNFFNLHVPTGNKQ